VTDAELQQARETAEIDRLKRANEFDIAMQEQGTTC
jgi:hypothetical protein